jgi:hypothetical protein
MTTRLVPAAAQLIAEIGDTGRRYKVSSGDPDGLGFIREVTFDPRTSKWLIPILDACDDERIMYSEYNNKGRATIVFVRDTRADFKHPFGIAAVDKVLSDDE